MSNLKAVKMCISLPVPVRDQLKAAASKQGVTVSQLVALACRGHFEHEQIRDAAAATWPALGAEAAGVVRAIKKRREAR